MTARSRMALLAALAVLLAGGVGGIAAYSLYRAALKHNAEFLSAVVRAERTLATQVFEDALADLGGDTASALGLLTERLRSANRDFVGFGATGELTVGRHSGDTLLIEVGIRGDSVRLPEPVLLPSPLAIPMQRALRGDTGVSEETDYSGARVLAAYGPIPGTGLAVTAKMDLWEIRRPHLRAAVSAGLVAGALILLALYLARGVARDLLAEIEEREDAHRALLQDFPGIVFRAVLDDHGEWQLRVLEGAVEEITGVTAAELGSGLEAWRAHLHEADRSAFGDLWAAYSRGDADQAPAASDYRFVRPDGRQVWVRLQARLHGSSRLAGLEGPAVSGVVLDVTAERRALEVRERAEDQLHALVRHLPRAAVHVLDRELRYLFSGGEALAEAGLTHEALQGRHVLDVLGPELGGGWVSMYERVLGGSTERRTAESGGHSFEVTAAPLRTPGGDVDRILVLSVDVTDQLRGAAASAAVEARFQAFMDASPAPAWIKDAEGRHLWVNRAWEEAFGLSRAEWEGLTDRGAFPPATAEVLHANDLEVLRSGRPLALVEDTGDSEESRRTWQVVKFPLVGPGGEPQVAGIAVDITRERVSEAALRESDERLRLAVAAGGQGLWDLDLRTGNARVDETYARMLGYDPGTFVETNPAWRDRLHPDDRATVYGEYEAYVAGERDMYRVEFRSRTADGGWRWILSQGEIVERDAEGRPTRMMGTHTDIQGPKDAEAALRESEDRFRRAVESSPEAIFIETGSRFAYLNPAAAAFFGVEDAAALVDTPVLDRFVARDREAVASRIRRLNDQRMAVENQVETVLRIDGTEFQAEFSAVPFRYHGSDGALVFARDISERTAAEKRLRANLDELQRWQAVMLDREDRVQELKREVNDLCRRAGQVPRYTSATLRTPGEGEDRP